MSKEMTLSREQAEEFYVEHKDAEFFETLVTNMTRFVLMIYSHSLSYLPVAKLFISIFVELEGKK